MGVLSLFFPSLLTTSSPILTLIHDMFLLMNTSVCHDRFKYKPSSQYQGGMKERRMEKNLMRICSIILIFLLIWNTQMLGIAHSKKPGPETPPSPPPQPADGPGGTNYSHEGVRQSQYRFGAFEFWIFEPTDPTPTKAPLIVFNHGWSALYPYFYKAWVDHLVKRGNIVVYPRYQRGLYIGLRYATQNAIRSVQQAIVILQKEGHVHPELDKFAIVGHSLGGGITVEMAALAEQNNLPVPKAIMPVQPFLRNDSMMKNYSTIPASTLMLVVVGKDDVIAGNYSAEEIFRTSTQIPLDNKAYIIQQTDRHGSPALLADHGAPVAISDSFWVNAMDYYSTWKLFDALTDYAFYGTERSYCLGNTSEQRFMGYWSDGVPVKELVVTDIL
jgi:dienelactone hydrolase